MPGKKSWSNIPERHGVRPGDITLTAVVITAGKRFTKKLHFAHWVAPITNLVPPIKCTIEELRAWADKEEDYV